jgi:hypothetical protein
VGVGRGVGVGEGVGVARGEGVSGERSDEGPTRGESISEGRVQPPSNNSPKIRVNQRLMGRIITEKGAAVNAGGASIRAMVVSPHSNAK